MKSLTEVGSVSPSKHSYLKNLLNQSLMVCNVNVEFHDMFFLYYLENQLLLQLRGKAFVCLIFSCVQNEVTGTVLQREVESQSGLPGVV